MEKSIDFLELVKAQFGCGDVDIRTFSPLTLAFIGDGVYELVVRSIIVERGNKSVESIHKEKSRYVKAQTQAAMADAIQELLTPVEQAVYRRGRNSNIHSSAKNASMSEYRKATGFEALCGFLYLQGENERMMILVKAGFEKLALVI
ncbi:MAG: ribonuclease III [Clostridiales bacterium]|nr:ribonuclease III [Clostridiales bacterium]